MWKNMYIAVRTSILMTSILFIGFFALWKSVDTNSTNLMQNSITNQMTDAVRSRSEIIDNYVKTAEETLITFGLSEEVYDILNNPTEENQLKAQAYTESFSDAKGIFEGLYIADYDTQILTHVNTGAVGTYNKAEGDARTNFQNTVLAKRELTNVGILKSPSSGEMVIAMYSPVYQNDKCIGFVGAGVYAKNLMDSLLSLNVVGLPNCEYVFLNVANGNYLYNKDPELLNTQTTDTGYLEIMQKLSADSSIDVGIHNYIDETGNEKMVIYRNFPSRGWVFALKDSKDNIFSALNGLRKTTGLICVIVGAGIVFILLIILSSIGRQLKLISNSITRFGEMDLTVDEGLLKYEKNKDEVGIIAAALSTTCRNLDKYISEVDVQLSAMANGDFSKQMTMEFIGTFKSVRHSMVKIQSALRKSFKEIHQVTSELAIGSNVVAESATTLAETSVNASQLILDIDTHVNTLSDQVSNSADSAEASKVEMDQTTQLVLDSQSKMTELSSAMVRISDSAATISNISKDMESIAKQTNILALNALVEAQRAGESGKGFGVVAHEIRSLALLSNDAATKATQQITSVLDCIKEGLDIGKETSDYLETVVNQTKHIDASITSIAELTKTQNESLLEVRNRLHEVNQTIESNAAMAEQSSAASTELDGQIVVLKENISKYKV